MRTIKCTLLFALTSWGSGDVGVFLCSYSFFGGNGVHGQGDEYLYRVQNKVMIILYYIRILYHE